jgi:CRISPR/Cas system-associated protein endoribonuclease Cas2
MKPSVYYGWLERIGLGDIAGIDLPSETPSALKPQEQFNEYMLEYHAVDGYMIEDFSVEAKYWKDIRNINTKIYQECKHSRFP